MSLSLQPLELHNVSWALFLSDKFVSSFIEMDIADVLVGVCVQLWLWIRSAAVGGGDGSVHEGYRPQSFGDHWRGGLLLHNL